ncbi:hypothetical protein BC831DRAFT_442488 [Entophlyctis helioformis]|nr:hypothetical protein BC831DRAFT_442488 [Entophlyctis helioformis]
MPLIMSRRIVLCATACRPVRQKTRLPTLAWICRPIPPRPYAVYLVRPRGRSIATRSCSRQFRSGSSRLRAASPRQGMWPQAYLLVCRSPRHHRPAVMPPLMPLSTVWPRSRLVALLWRRLPKATRISRATAPNSSLSGACSLARRGRTPITQLPNIRTMFRSLASTWAWTWAWTWALT